MEAVDVLIVGAGLSGIGAAHHLAEHLPKKTYAIVEGRDRLGGTWDLFRYPGIRSDSGHVHARLFVPAVDGPKRFADGASILSLHPERGRGRTASSRRSRSARRSSARGWGG